MRVEAARSSYRSDYDTERVHRCCHRPGGKIIQGIQEETGAVITIEETDGVGVVQVSGANKDVIDAALGKIKSIVLCPKLVRCMTV